MSTKIIPKRSSVAGKSPLSSDLQKGEIAVNFEDGVIYGKHPTNDLIVNLSGAAELHNHSISQITNLQTELDGKENTISSGSITQYYRGDKTWQTLNTANVTESTNLYYTDARVRSVLLTGYTTGSNTALSATDSLLNAFGKLQGQINSRLTSNQSISISGDATGSGTTSITLTLANSGVVAGSYPKVTVDSKGRVTTGTQLTASDIPSLDWSKITTGKPTTISGYGITDALTLGNTVGTTLGTASAGTATTAARSDHVHPLQTAVSGNAGTATKLQTAVTINGSSFDGSSNITTTNWGTARTLTVGNTGKSVNGSGNVSWSLTEIGAAASSHNHTLDSLSNVTITSNATGELLRWNGTQWVNATLAEAGIQPSGAYLTGNQNISISGDATGSGTTSIALTLANSGVTAGTYGKVTVDTKGRVTAGTSLVAADIPSLDASKITSGTIADARLSGTYTGVNITGNAATATKLETARQINGVNFDGTANITVNDSTKLPLTGGSLSGTLVITTPGTANTIASLTGSSGKAFEVRSTGNNATAGSATIMFHRPGVHAAYLGLDTDNQLKFGGYSVGAIAHKIWHEGSDGVGSGLDADLLDGQQGSYYLNASNINAGTLNDACLPSTMSAKTFTGKVVMPASVTASASLNLPHGATPTTLANGDVWTTTSGLYARINGTTRTYVHTGTYSTVAQAEAEAGTATSIRWWTSQSVRQSTAAYAYSKTEVDTKLSTVGAIAGVFYENDNMLAQNYTITTGKNAMSAGPIEIANGVSVEIPNGSAWVIV